MEKVRTRTLHDTIFYSWKHTMDLLLAKIFHHRFHIIFISVLPIMLNGICLGRYFRVFSAADVL